MHTMGEARVVIGDDMVEMSDESVETTDDVVVSTREMVQAVVTPEVAADALQESFGALVDADYLPGKTGFRDVLCGKFELSEIEAEELVDALEALGYVRFISSDDGLGWCISRADSGP